jgi:hypothetical protein
MDLWLHIGCEKTGTTSVQQWLDRNSAALRAHGVVYSETLGRPSSKGLVLLGLTYGGRDQDILGREVASAAEFDALRTRLRTGLEAEVAAARNSGARHFVASQELCQSRLRDEPSVAALRAAIAAAAAHAVRVRIVCVLRPQIDTCLSLASTLSRLGWTIDRDWVGRQMRPGMMFYRLDLLLARWAAVFGTAAVIPVPYRRHRDVVGWFEAALGVENAGLTRPPQANTALDYRTIALVNALGREHRLRPEIESLPVEERLTLGRADATALQALFAESNAAVCSTWPDIREADLTPDWSRVPEQGTIDRLNDLGAAAPMLRQLVARLRTQPRLTRV